MEVAREGMVLLKNEGNVLPLVKSRQKLLVVGPNATPAAIGGGGSSYTTPFRAVSVLDALRKMAPAGTTVDYTPGYSSPANAASETDWTTASGETGVEANYYAGSGLKGEPILSRTEPRIDNRWGDGGPDAKVRGPFSARWKGRYTPKESGKAQLVASADDGIRVFVDGKLVIDQWHDQGATSFTAPLELTVGKPIDVTVEYYQGGGEAVARVGISSGIDNALEKTLPSKTVEDADVVIACVGWNGKDRYEGEGSDRPWSLPAEQVAMLERLTALNKRVVVVLNAGAGVATKGWIEKTAGFVHAGYPGGEGNLALAEILYGKSSPSGKLPTSFPATLEGTYYADAYPSVDRKMVYREGPYIGYRWFDKNGVAPLYPFGYGLTYSSFKLSRPKAEGGQSTKVTLDVKNTGSRKATETVQVYAEPPVGVERAPRELRAFQRVELRPGETKRIELTFDNRDLAHWNATNHHWEIAPGTYTLRIGTSSRDLPLSVKVKTD